MDVFDVVLIMLVLNWIKADTSSAAEDFDRFVDSQRNVIDNIGVYLKEHTRRMKLIRKYIREYKDEQLKMEELDYFKNPINAFTLIKRLTADLTFILDVSKMDTELILRNKELHYPTKDDLDDAAIAVARVQDKDLASDDIKDNFGTPMSASDCFEIARALYKRREIGEAIKWWKETLNKYNTRKEEDIYNFSDVGLTRVIRNAYSEMDDIKNVLVWTEKLLTFDPTDTEAKQLVRRYKKRLYGGKN